MRESLGRSGTGWVSVRDLLNRLMARGGDDVPRYLALQDSARVGRTFALLTVGLIAVVAGWGNRPLIAAIVAAGLVAGLLFRRVAQDSPARQHRLAIVAPACWAVGLMLLAVAAHVPSTGDFVGGPLLVIAIAAAGSFCGTLPPRNALIWLAVTTPLVWAVSMLEGHGEPDVYLAPIGMLVSGTLGVAASVARREAELDRRDLTELARHLDATAPVPTMAAGIVESIAGWGMFDSVLLVGFEGRRAAIVLGKSVHDVDVVPFEIGESLPAPRVAYLRERAERGPWIERARAEAVAERGRTVRAGSEHAVAYVPVVGDEGPVGLIVAAARAAGSQSGLSLLADELPVLVDAAAMAAGGLVPVLTRKGAEVEQRETITETIGQRRFTPVFQPVLDLGSGAVVGFEALTRFADGTPPDRMFASAERLGLGLALEEVTLAAAVEAARDLPSAAWLSLNLSPSFLLSGRPLPILAAVTRDVVIELTEHVAIDDYAVLREAVAELGPNVRLAVDDAGAGFASLRHVIELEPHIVKLDLALVRGIDADRARQALLSSLCHFASKTNCRLLAEGIETEAELATIRSLGIELGQGFLLGRPARVLGGAAAHEAASSRAA